MTTTNFDFLNGFNDEAYEIAIQIEDEITTSPASIKTHATGFLECIVDDMLLKTGNKDIIKKTTYSPKVQKLKEFDHIKYSFESMLLNAYQLRNTIHFSMKKTKEEDKRLVLELHEKLFHIAWRYFDEFGGNDFDYHGKPKYRPPFRENDAGEIIEVPNIERMERVYDHCIICGRKNNSKFYNICNSCNSRIEHVEDIINLKNNFDSKFTKRQIINLGYSKVYSDALIRELLDEKLILKTDKAYQFNDDIFNDYLYEIEQYGDIETVLLEFASGKLRYSDIKESEYYLKGKEGQKPFVQVYRIVSDAVFKEFLSQINLNIPIRDIIEDSSISMEEVQAWYDHQRELSQKGIKNPDFIKFNRILIDSYISLRRQSKLQDEIVDELGITNDMVDFWMETTIKELDYFKVEIEDIKLDLILKAVNENKTKEEICALVDISENELADKLQLGRDGNENYRTFYEIFQREYEYKRKNDFLYYLNENNLENSTRKAYLSKKDIDEWYLKGEKEFALGHFDKYADFYLEVTEKLMKHYIRYRKDALSKKQAAEKIGKNVKTVEKWLRADDHEIFTNFQQSLEDITVNILISALKKSMTLKQASNLVDLSKNQVVKFIKLGENGDERYIELCKTYRTYYVPNQLNVFLKTIKEKNKKRAIKASHLTEDEINEYYTLGVEGDELYEKFAEEYFQYKLNNYVKEIFKGKTPNNAFRNSDMTETDEIYHAEDMENVVIERQLEKVMPLIEDNTTKMISNETKIDIETLFDWYIRGWEGDERFKEYSEELYENQLVFSAKNAQRFFDKGMSERFFLKNVLKRRAHPDYHFAKKIGMINVNTENNALTDKDQYMIYKNCMEGEIEISDVLELISEDAESLSDLIDEDMPSEINEPALDEDDDDNSDVKDKISEILGIDSDDEEFSKQLDSLLEKKKELKLKKV